MSWEALRLTSRSPAEIYHVMGPGGVDGLVRQVFTSCWNALPAEGRDFAAWEKLAREVYQRNMAVWDHIRRPSPDNFFHDMRPEPQDGFMRQAMVLCFMMLPRGYKNLANVHKVVGGIFERNLAAWEADNHTFLKGPAKRKASPPKRSSKKSGARG
jgi:hypothetical protein